MQSTASLRRALALSRAVGHGLVHDPLDTVVTVRERIAEHEEHHATRTRGVGGFMPWPPCPYPIDTDAERRLHEIAGAPWPCPEAEAFWSLWSEVIDWLQERFEIGRGAFGGWGDGEPGLVRTIWCLTRHMRPRRVVETGVARGITTRFILEALERNGHGRLWSIDLPPPQEPRLHEQIAVAVPQQLRPRWTYVRGSSRRRLPHLLAEVEPIDLFVHDSWHSARNLLFELNCAWRSLNLGGAVVADDVDLNCGFHTFRAAHRDAPSLICHAEPLAPDVGRQDDLGVYGIVWRNVRDRV